MLYNEIICRNIPPKKNLSPTYKIYIEFIVKCPPNSGKIPPKSVPKFPQIRCQNSPKFRVKITPKKSFLSRPPRPPDFGPKSPQNQK